MLSKEIYEDTQLFTMVEETGRLKLLDVFLFGKENEQDFKKLHLAIHTGEHDELGNPLLIHANGIQKRVSVWPLKQFLSYPQYKKSMP